jgi:hypothetical protein
MYPLEMALSMLSVTLCVAYTITIQVVVPVAAAYPAYGK